MFSLTELKYFLNMHHAHNQLFILSGWGEREIQSVVTFMVRDSFIKRGPSFVLLPLLPPRLRSEEAKLLNELLAKELLFLLPPCMKIESERERSRS